MRAYNALHHDPHENLGRYCVGLAKSFTKEKALNGKWKRLPIAGEIFLCKHRLQVRIVSHEVAHAMFGVLRRKGVNFTDGIGPFVCNAEEKACGIVGDMTAEICYRLRKFGMPVRG